jgi:3D (Asp-Asp-Asp) domain-containing protein
MRLLALMLLLAMAPALARAGGVSSLIDQYVDAVESGDPRAEEEAARPLIALIDAGDDISVIVRREVARRLAARAAVAPECGAAADAPGVPAGYKRITDQRPTYYFTTREAGFPASGVLFGVNYDGTERRQIRTPSGALIKETSGRYFASLVMEGSGILADGRGVSYVSNKRFQVLPALCNGLTATGNWVVRFHTLAVNKREMPYGGVYFLPKTQGLVMPDGQVHDGFWFAHDTGSAFQGTPKHRIDMYVDEEAWVKWAEQNLIPSFTAMPVYRVDEATKRAVYAKYQAQLGGAR